MPNNTQLSVPLAVHDQLRTLRRALSLAYHWDKLERMPKLGLAKGKSSVSFLSDEEVALYLFGGVATLLYTASTGLTGAG